MASFENVRHCEPSAYAEGFGTFWIPPSDVGSFHAATRTASARSELATPGNAVRSTRELLTRALEALQPSVSPVRALVIQARRVA